MAERKTYRRDIARMLAEAEGLSLMQAQRLLGAALDIIEKSLQEEGSTVALRGFGTFQRRQRAPRSYKHPKTGQTTESAPKIYVHFKPAEGLCQVPAP